MLFASSLAFGTAQLRLSLALRYEFIGSLGKVSFIYKIWRILLISLLPSPIFCYWFLLLRKNNMLWLLLNILQKRRIWDHFIKYYMNFCTLKTTFEWMVLNQHSFQHPYSIKILSYISSFLIIHIFFWMLCNFSFPKLFYNQLVTEFISCLKLWQSTILIHL